MKYYLQIGIVIGILQVVDAIMLFANNGNVASGSAVFSLIEFGWAIVSLVIFCVVKKQKAKQLAGIFFGYNLAGWILGALLVDPKVEIIAVPIPLVIIGGAFGVFYGYSCLKLHQHEKTNLKN